MEFSDNDQLERTLNLGLKENPQAVIQLGSPLVRQAGPRVAQILSTHRIPGISQFRTFPDGGGLMSYGPDLNDLYRRIGVFMFPKFFMVPTPAIYQLNVLLNLS